MKRGQIRPTTRAEAVARARSLVGVKLPLPPGAPSDAVPTPLRYRLTAGHNGGADPYAPHPGSPSYGNRVWTADCIGFVAWCLGLDRYQPGELPSRGGYLNTDSALIDARTSRRYFAEVEVPEPGDIVVYGSKYALGVRTEVGHVGLVVAAPTGLDPWTARVVDCSASASRKVGAAVSERPDARVWRRRGSWLRYVRALP